MPFAQAFKKRSRIIQDIYLGVKANNLGLARECSLEVVQDLCQSHGDIPVVLGCTVIPLGLQGTVQLQSHRPVDPEKVLNRAQGVNPLSPMKLPDLLEQLS